MCLSVQSDNRFDYIGTQLQELASGEHAVRDVIAPWKAQVLTCGEKFMLIHSCAGALRLDVLVTTSRQRDAQN